MCDTCGKNKVKLVAFTMDRCPHCVQLKNHLKEIDLDYTHYSVDNPKGQKMIEKWGVTNFPTLFFVKDNVILDAQVGFDTGTDMRKVLKEYDEKTK